MLDSFFSKGAFKGAKCKTLLKLTIPRIKLLRNRREVQLKQMRRDIAKLLENGQEATARIRVEHIVREENMMAAQEILELFCELIAVRLPIIETQRECPLDLKEAISSICFAAPRCADLPELQQVQMLFAAKYGKEFVAAASELMPDCGVNRQIIELLSVRAPPVEVKLKLLKEIAEEHELDWDPSETETEFFKPHEDLLNGPSYFTKGSTLPLPKEKLDESSASNATDESRAETDADTGFDSFDLPEVPKASPRPVVDIQSAPENVVDAHVSPSSTTETNIGVLKSTLAEKSNTEAPIPSPYTLAEKTDADNRQFIPFASPPSFSSMTMKENEPAPVPPLSSSSITMLPIEPEISPPPISAASARQSEPGFSPEQSERAISSPPLPPESMPSKQPEQAHTYSHTKSGASADLQDVLAAAQAAADTAERAAAAARAAANLAQIRISDLVAKNTKVSDGYKEAESENTCTATTMSEKRIFEQQDSFSQGNPGDVYKGVWVPTAEMELPESLGSKEHGSKEQMPEHQTSHVPQRLPSLEDDPYFSYPNLFTSRDSNAAMGADNSCEHPRFDH